MDTYTGWDLGGAHLKLARIDAQGRLLCVRQVPSPLWEGLERLDRALDQALPECAAGSVHTVTMTGELADVFIDRRAGVTALVERMQGRWPGARLRVYAGRGGLLDPERAAGEAGNVASANWHAAAGYVARSCRQGILVDIGSTTSDLVYVHDGRIAFQGYSDGERLASEELVYTGVVRTPVMTVVQRVPFNGAWQSLVAERFATMLDVYRMSGALGTELEPFLPDVGADGRGLAPVDCARRLARMLGRDLHEGIPADWRQVARTIGRAQEQRLLEALERLRSRYPDARRAPLVGAGLGRFLVRRLAAMLGCIYIDFSELVSGPPALREEAAVCAPATALAYLGRTGDGRAAH